MALLVTGGLACGGDSPTVVDPPAPGTLEVTTQTSGFLKDDGYELFVDGQSRGSIGADAVATIPGLDPASYQVSLDGVADNCTVEHGTGSIPIEAGATASITVIVSCAHAPAAAYEGLRASRDRLNLENGEVIECSFGICPSDNEWDMYVEFVDGSEPQAVIRQNQITVVEIAHLAGVSFSELSEDDYAGAAFTTDFVEEPLAAGSVVLIRTDQGNVYAIGNALVVSGFTPTLTVDAALIDVPE